MFLHIYLCVTNALLLMANAYKTCFGPYENYSCDEYLECCSTGCCADTSFNDYMWIIGATFLSIIIVICACFCYRKRRANNRLPETRTNAFENADIRVISNARHDFGFRPFTPTVNEAPPQVPTDPHPITPPPSYENALFSPLLFPDNRVPSYEDVMAGKKT
ncbi:hypothetical protein Zmor_027315 [Zophobas morio]|uniref:Vesicular, overexpressed in cancer, prosurvival protein 1 n=1 Tax=Zophobas morio TaxID=2755281 RepID=A0AA38HMX2_9CUCU|nr:hypothetical protein Zmor_027315 [Zophobas morio]